MPAAARRGKTARKYMNGLSFQAVAELRQMFYA